MQRRHQRSCGLEGAEQRGSSSFDAAAACTRHVSLLSRCCANAGARSAQLLEPSNEPMNPFAQRDMRYTRHPPYTREIPIHAAVSASVTDDLACG